MGDIGATIDRMNRERKEKVEREGAFKISESRHNELIDIQKRQIKISEQQTTFTTILALGTVILAFTAFIQVFNVEELVIESVKNSTFTYVLLIALSTIAAIFMIFIFAYLLILTYRLPFKK